MRISRGPYPQRVHRDSFENGRNVVALMGGDNRSDDIYAAVRFRSRDGNGRGTLACRCAPLALRAPTWVMRRRRLPPLLVLTWLIIVPPSNVTKPEEWAPLGRWQQYAAFEKKVECVRYLKKKVADARNAAVMMWCKYGETCARCVSEEEFTRWKAAGASGTSN